MNTLNEDAIEYIRYSVLSKARDILKQWWGYDSFRPLQEDIVDSIIAGRDTLALLPTGGGKSICFQVPALMQPGICIVISPLIALMKDQVENLQQRGIKALSVTSELKPQQLDAVFDRCIYEDEVKFLYLSPERLKTDLARQRISKMKVNLIAVDEAHCISEWGYDFRPPYLDIAEIRPLHPEVPVLALTASATPKVVDDIQERLSFKSKNVLRKSFFRDNLAYFIDWDEDKMGKIERIAIKQGGSGIVYMRSRRGCERIARALQERGLSADHYHAGLDTDERTKRQQAWMEGKTQIIVATNAFGMGIDKPDVRFVVHCDLPDTLENYYQECGRGGRDGKKAFAISLLTQKDVDSFDEKVVRSFPKKETIRSVYESLGSLLQLAIGSGQGETFRVDLDILSQRTGLDIRALSHCLKFIEREGHISIQERSRFQSEVKIITTHESVRSLRDQESTPGQVLEALLRSYPRLFDETSMISEWTLARRLGLDKQKVIDSLIWLDQSGHIAYAQASELPTITFLEERIPTKNLRLSDEHYRIRKHVLQEKAEAMRNYVNDTHQCRSRMILSYFGEIEAEDCGMCYVCLQRK